MSFAQNLGLLILRLGLGAVTIAHGGQKLFGWFPMEGQTLEDLSGLLAQEGFSTTTVPVIAMPMNEFMAYLVGIGEFFGGVLLVLGVLPRTCAFFIAGIMAGAISLVHWPMFFAGDGGFEFPMSLLALALGVLLLGAGRWGLWPKG